MQVLNWFLEEQKQEKPLTFLPKINIDKKSTLYVEVQPKQPNNTSNIVLTAFASEKVRSIIPIRVQWSRFKLRLGVPSATQRLHSIIGNTYFCQPSDVGGYIQAHIRSFDQTLRAQAQVTIGPIGIDPLIKQVLEGALYRNTLLSQVTLWQKQRSVNINLRLTPRSMQLMSEGQEQPLNKQYTISQPKIQLNPKDPTRVYMRFQQDQTNSVRQWLNNIFQTKNRFDQSSIHEDRVQYSSSSSRHRLFSKPQGHCINKVQIKFISRHSRDLFLFCHQAFICREDMKNSVYIQRIQRLQSISTEQDYYHFLSYMSLKQQINRIAQVAVQLQEDRDAKVRDITAMQQSIHDMTQTYLTIIQSKGKQQHIDFQHSYSVIGQTRQQYQNKRNVRQLKSQIEGLKKRVRELNEELQLAKFFRKQENESIIFNQTSNPFTKKDISISRVGNIPENRFSRNNMHEISINYANLLEENKQLRAQLNYPNKHQRSQNMMQLLGSLDQREQPQKRVTDLQQKMNQSMRKVSDWQRRGQQNDRKIAGLLQQNTQLKNRIKQLVDIQNRSGFNYVGKSMVYDQSVIGKSVLNQSNNQSINQSAINHSNFSQSQFISKLQHNIRTLSTVNKQQKDDLKRIRQQRDKYRTKCHQFQNIIKQLQSKKSQKDLNQNNQQQIQNLKEQNQKLTNQKKTLQKKIQSLTSDEVQKYKKQIKRLQQQIIFLKKSSDAINRSRDLTMEMDMYNEQKFELVKQQNQRLLIQNQNISKMCQKYGKDARQATKQLNKWRQKAMALMRAKTQQSSILS